MVILAILKYVQILNKFENFIVYLLVKGYMLAERLELN